MTFITKKKQQPTTKNNQEALIKGVMNYSSPSFPFFPLSLSSFVSLLFFSCSAKSIVSLFGLLSDKYVPFFTPTDIIF